MKSNYLVTKAVSIAFAVSASFIPGVSQETKPKKESDKLEQRNSYERRDPSERRMRDHSPKEFRERPLERRGGQMRRFDNNQNYFQFRPNQGWGRGRMHQRQNLLGPRHQMLRHKLMLRNQIWKDGVMSRKERQFLKRHRMQGFRHPAPENRFNGMRGKRGRNI